MTVVKTSKGYQIRLESGKLMPKVYVSEEAAKKRITQMEKFKESELRWMIDNKTMSLVEAEGIKKLRIMGTALAAETSRNGSTYTVNALAEQDGQAFSIIGGHQGDNWDNPKFTVGEGVYKFAGGTLDYDAVITNTAEYPDIIEQVQKGYVAPSIDGKGVVRREGDQVFVDRMRIPIMALVNKHVRGVESSSVDVAIAESLAKGEQNEMEANNMAEVEELKAEVAKLTEALHASQEEMKKMMEDKKKMMMEEEGKKKKKLTESIMSFNKELKEAELLEKSVEVLELMEAYEKKSAVKPTGAALVADEGELSRLSEREDLKGIIVDERNGDITMDANRYGDFNKSLRESIYR